MILTCDISLSHASLYYHIIKPAKKCLEKFEGRGRCNNIGHVQDEKCHVTGIFFQNINLGFLLYNIAWGWL